MRHIDTGNTQSTMTLPVNRRNIRIDNTSSYNDNIYTFCTALMYKGNTSTSWYISTLAYFNIL